MADPKTCSQCGAELTADAPQGLCPICLFQHGMDLRLLSKETFPSISAKPVIRYFGDYEIQHEIARGGMGAVFKAWQLKLNRPVAIKMILEGRLADEEAVKRFYTEAEAAANLQHPNIVAIHEIGNHEGQHYFSMDYVDGQNLSQLTHDKPLAPTRAAEYVKTLAQAIHYAHQRGTLHRDLKPSNVLIDHLGNLRITDFGLAKMVNSDRNVTVSGAVLGTPSYMAPEQAMGRQDQIGPGTDVYSLGAILYELLTGRPPFIASTPMATVRAVIDNEPMAIRRINRAVPVDLEVICLKCLQKAPQRRYSSARDLAEELDRFLKGDPILACPPSPVHKAANWLRRHPGQLAALAALVMLGMAIFLFYMIEQNAFLRARLDPEGSMPQPGIFTAAMQQWKAVNNLTTTLGVLVSTWYVLRSRRAHWRALLTRDIWYRPAHPVGSNLRWMMCLMGLINLVCAAALTGCIIRAHVWESVTPRFGYGATAYLVGWLGLYLPWMAWQDYRRSVVGWSSHELSREQADAIRGAASESGVAGAVRMYRQAIPNASAIEAREHVLQLMQQHGIRPSLEQLNGWRMAVSAAILAGILAIQWILVPSIRTLPVLGSFAAGAFLGLTCAALPRINGVHWRIFIMVVPVIVLYIAVAMQGLSAVAGPCFAGVIFGISVMRSGLIPRTPVAK